jgi:hypothetical protein
MRILKKRGFAGGIKQQGLTLQLLAELVARGTKSVSLEASVSAKQLAPRPQRPAGRGSSAHS